MVRIARFSALLCAAATVWAAAAPFARADQPHAWSLWMQAAGSPIMTSIESLNGILTVIIVLIVLAVFGLMGYVMVRFRAGRNPQPARWSHNTPLEIAWTLLPVLILVVIAFPSFRLLFAMDRIKDADLTVKVTGHQWYWSYSYPDSGVMFDAMMLQDDDLPPGEPRLLATDTHLVLPVGRNIRIQITADDVIHSWSVPSLGLKTDAIPGRLNETWVRIERPGKYYGQCSQLCGVNHGFMPIEVEALPPDQYAAWMADQQAKLKSSDAAQPSLPKLAQQ